MAQELSKVITGRGKAGVDVIAAGDVALINVVGLVDEKFAGFGDLGTGVKTAVINVAGMTRMTSFGVRQWLKGMDALPKSIEDLYLLGCPTFFVDQLNMVLNFGGAGQILTVLAPYNCPGCGVESGETIDVLVDRATLAKGGVSDKDCARCGGRLEFDETPESYFAFVPKYAATNIQPAAAKLLAQRNLYLAIDASAEKPPKIIKLVHGSVTYFRIIGTIGSMFRARPFLVGAEGEVAIDLAEVDRFEVDGQREWKRLLKSLTGQVPSVTLIDVDRTFLASASDSLMLARNIHIYSVRIPYQCVDCARVTSHSYLLEGASWPLHIVDKVCPTCGGTACNQLSLDALTPLQKASTGVPSASSKMIAQREEVLSRARTDANVAQAGEGATAAIGADDMILGKYKIVRRLSAGGMAEVFLAKQVGIGGFEKPVALKRIQRQLLDSRHLAIDMFLNEAKIAGRLMHPNIVQVLDVAEVGGALYLAMEYVNGRDLRDLVKRMRSTKTLMPIAEACLVVREVAQALHHAYWSTDMAGKQLAVVHRDVSPHNIILSFDGVVKLLDFGVAMSSVTEQSDESMIVGKWLYMSPESTLNQQVDHRSDLFSLGVIAYLLLCGSMPFTGTDPKEIVRKVRAGQYKPLVEKAPSLPPELSALVDQMLAPKPDDRPQTGLEIVTILNEIARSLGLESSQSRLSQLVSQIFASELATVEPAFNQAPAPPIETRRASVTSPPFNAAPPPSSSFSTPPQIDVSVSLHGRHRTPESVPSQVAPDPEPDQPEITVGTPPTYVAPLPMAKRRPPPTASSPIVAILAVAMVVTMLVLGYVILKG